MLHPRYDNISHVSRTFPVERCPTEEAARRFGYSHGSFRNLCSQFVNAEDPDFLFPAPAGAKPPKAGPGDGRTERRQRVMDLGEVTVNLPGSGMIPADCALRALLALKLWGIGRKGHVMPEILDEGIALFVGLNAMPKRATLTALTFRQARRGAAKPVLQTMPPKFALQGHRRFFGVRNAAVQRYGWQMSARTAPTLLGSGYSSEPPKAPTPPMVL